MPLSPGPRWSGAVPPPALLADQRSQTPGSSAIESAANRPPGRADVMALDADGWGSYAPRGGATDPALDRAGRRRLPDPPTPNSEEPTSAVR